MLAESPLPRPLLSPTPFSPSLGPHLFPQSLIFSLASLRYCVTQGPMQSDLLYLSARRSHSRYNRCEIWFHQAAGVFILSRSLITGPIRCQEWVPRGAQMNENGLSLPFAIMNRNCKLPQITLSHQLMLTWLEITAPLKMSKLSDLYLRIKTSWQVGEGEEGEEMRGGLSNGQEERKKGKNE